MKLASRFEVNQFGSKVARLVLLSLALLACFSPAWARAEDFEAERAFTRAAQLFDGGWYDKAQKEFAEFLAGFPHSTNRNQALLLQAESLYQLKDYSGVVRLLQDQPKAGEALADQYLYWLAEAHARQDHFEAAAKSYRQLLAGFPQSKLRLEASYGEAFARFKLGDATRAVQLLRERQGAFQQAAQGSTNQAVLVQGNFLLAEALFARKDFAGARQTLVQLNNLSPEAEFERGDLLARVELAEQKRLEALSRVTNLVAIAKAQSNAVLRARSLTLKAEILRDTDPEAAVQAYEQIPGIPGISADQSRQAILRIVELATQQKKLTNAIDRLEVFLKANPQDSASDLFRLTLGELYLKEFYTESPTNALQASANGTNLLSSARGQFDQIIKQFTNSQYLGKAYLDRGWTLWEESRLLREPSRVSDARGAFQGAVVHLPKSVDNATARFKLIDCSLLLKDYTNAVANGRALLSEYDDAPEARQKLFDHALYQMIEASLELKDRAGAKTLLDRLLKDFPNSPWADDALYRYGQALAQAGEFSGARAIFADFGKRFPDSPLLPQARLAAANTCIGQMDWTGAINLFNGWLTGYPTNAARPEAEYYRAWCYYQSGAETNAYGLFTNLVQQFPSSAYAPLARLWVGSFLLNQREYTKAEVEYQLLYMSTNTTALGLAQQAKIMAAKAAIFNQHYAAAQGYLTNLLNEPQLGSEIEPQAWFMLGDIELEDPNRDSLTNRMAKFEQAIVRFEKVVHISTNRLVPLALGRMADCNFQLGAQNSARYQTARELYTQVIAHPLSDASTRSQAEVGLGRVLEKMADLGTNRTELLSEALTHYLNVVYPPQGSEEVDPFWLKEAGLKAGSLAVEGLHNLDQAERLYSYLLRSLPSFRSIWETKLAALRQLRSKP